MKKAYLFLSILMVLVAISLLLLPGNKSDEQVAPQELLAKIADQSRYLSTDQVAQLIISQDPSLLLIDSRDTVQYNDYHLPGAFSVPASDIADDKYRDLLEQEGKITVFYSNDDILAEQSWVLGIRMGMENSYVMKDGLNRWMETIIRPQRPPDTAPGEEFDLYQFRLGASLYFGGGSSAAPAAPEVSAPVVLQKKVKKSAAEGGC